MPCWIGLGIESLGFGTLGLGILNFGLGIGTLGFGIENLDHIGTFVLGIAGFGSGKSFDLDLVVGSACCVTSF